MENTAYKIFLLCLAAVLCLAVSAPALGEAAAEPEGEKKRAYTFLDGRLTMRFSEDEFDVITEDNSENTLALERQGLTLEQADKYMNLSGYELKAIPIYEKIKTSNHLITLNIKEPKYPGIGSLKNLSQFEKKLLADAVAAGFSTTYEWYATEDAEYMVFDWNHETRYATIMDERMFYIFVTVDSGDPTDADREMLRSVIDDISWNDAGSGSR